MLRLHDDGGVFRAEEIAGVVDVGDELKVLLFHLRDRTGAHHACVREHEVEPAEQLYGPADHGGDGLLIVYVHRDGDGALAELLRDLLGKRLIHVRDDDRCAFLIQLLSDAFAEALRCAGHNADLACHAPHARRTVMDIFPGEFTPFCHVNTHNFAPFHNF